MNLAGLAAEVFLEWIEEPALFRPCDVILAAWFRGYVLGLVVGEVAALWPLKKRVQFVLSRSLDVFLPALNFPIEPYFWLNANTSNKKMEKL